MTHKENPTTNRIPNAQLFPEARAAVSQARLDSSKATDAEIDAQVDRSNAFRRKTSGQKSGGRGE